MDLPEDARFLVQHRHLPDTGLLHPARDLAVVTGAR